MSLTLEHVILVINGRRSFKCVRMLLDKTEIHPLLSLYPPNHISQLCTHSHVRHSRKQSQKVSMWLGSLAQVEPEMSNQPE
jgi:hypothetical protein